MMTGKVKNYLTPQIDLIALSCCDVITTSVNSYDNGAEELDYTIFGGLKL